MLKNTRLPLTTSFQASGYLAKGEQAFIPHYEPPKRWGDENEYPFTFIDYKSRLNREGRSQNCTWYQEFKKVDAGDESWDDVVRINLKTAKSLESRQATWSSLLP